ncbi:MAG TPA: ABC transporter permease [Terriglobia bacterium]|nr:ABC transporter permease [Terriglobia bacterium]
MHDYRTNVRENLLLAMDTLRTHKFRSFLTMLGVMIGVITVIMVASFLVGVESQMTDMAKSFGTDNLYIYKWQPGINFNLSREMRLRKPLTYDQAMAIKAECPNVENVAVEAVRWNSAPPDIKYRAQDMLDGNLVGATPSDFSISNTDLAEGRFYTEIDNWHRRNVTVLGSDVVTRLFPHEDPIGKTITIGGNAFEVIGAIGQRKSSFFDTGANRMVYIPYETYLKIYPATKENFIIAKAYPGKRTQAIDEVTGLLRRLRGDKPWQPSSFGIGTADSFIQQFNAIIGTTAIAVIALASVGLLVGGIGVMNIMLVSVTERTREIGVRKAIGARRNDITWQFLLEAMTLTGAGGIIGIIVSCGIVLLVQAVLPAWPLTIPIWAVVAGFVVSVSVGLFFGLWPAVKAARLDPIVALRYE